MLPGLIGLSRTVGLAQSDFCHDIDLTTDYVSLASITPSRTGGNKMSITRTLNIAIAVTAVFLTGCTAENTVAQTETPPNKQEGQPGSQHETPEDETMRETATPESASESSPEPTRHWLAPPPAPADAADDPTAWADYKYTEWLHGMNTTYRELCGELTTLEVYRDCVPDDPHAYITDFSATQIGELIITIGPGPWENGPYDTQDIPAAHFVAGNAPFHIAKFSTDFDSITAVTPDGRRYTEPYDPYLETYFDHVDLEDMAAGSTDPVGA